MLFFDLEIIATINPNRAYMPFQNVHRWDDKANMGIAVCGFYVSDLDRFDWFTLDWQRQPQVKNKAANEQAIALFREYADQAVGFNSRSFDDPLLRVNGFPEFQSRFDLLQLIRRQVFGSSDWRNQPKDYSYKLDRLAIANFGQGKIGDGALAPLRWQQGEYEGVVRYCLDDVRLLRDSFQRFHKGQLKDPNTGRLLGLQPS
ncbi:hypothetical protein AWQ21_15485 (plasmid) [Picosynechococcus sp. PCC 7003]|uniref:hypothetical protein n=1 Tax=Picosynechococcus sp. PCC 7003 TaxID=374981 RepID=UPI000810BE01|nr:hypothetical protein [Picosynechococcus sp. PCC 7003]ANV85928.1 hypothetical protein AWQ21_15485 [Picosynechococcus sp. PCC 7003]